MKLKYRLLKRVAGVEKDTTGEAVFDGAVKGYRLYGALGLLWEVHEPTREKLQNDYEQVQHDVETTKKFAGVLRRYL